MENSALGTMGLTVGAQEALKRNEEKRIADLNKDKRSRYVVFHKPWECWNPKYRDQDGNILLKTILSFAASEEEQIIHWDIEEMILADPKCEAELRDKIGEPPEKPPVEAKKIQTKVKPLLPADTAIPVQPAKDNEVIDGNKPTSSAGTSQTADIPTKN